VKKTLVWALALAVVLTACSGKTFKTSPTAPAAPVVTNTPIPTATGTNTGTPTASPTETSSPTITATPTAALPDFNLSGAVTTLNTGTYNFNCVHLAAGAVVTINGGVTIFCQCFTLDAGATITGVGMGYHPGSLGYCPGGGQCNTIINYDAWWPCGGGGHGGEGGNAYNYHCTLASGGVAADDPIHPIYMGGAGADPRSLGIYPPNPPSAGGGLIKIVAYDLTSSTLVSASINGTIDMSGIQGCFSCGFNGEGGGGGAGGTILIEASAILGTGLLSAEGGPGSGAPTFMSGGRGLAPGGGGGIISLIEGLTSFAGTLSIVQGAGGLSNTDGCVPTIIPAQPGIVTFTPAPATGY